MENKSTNNKRYYAVREGRKVGVFTKWSDAKQQIERFEGADYKVFDIKTMMASGSEIMKLPMLL